MLIFIAGFIVGGLFGMITFCLCLAAGDDRKDDDK